MQASEYIQRQVIAMRRLIDAIMQDTTDEQFNWAPGGTANAIRVTYVHMIAAEDMYIQAVLQGQPRIWESAGWGAQLGLSAPPGRDRGWDELKRTTLPLAPVAAYAQAVRGATDAYLEALTAEELDRQVAFLGGQRPVADVLATLIIHSVGHAGEIAALKGMQGVKGLPF